MLQNVCHVVCHVCQKKPVNVNVMQCASYTFLYQLILSKLLTSIPSVFSSSDSTSLLDHCRAMSNHENCLFLFVNLPFPKSCCTPFLLWIIYETCGLRRSGLTAIRLIVTNGIAWKEGRHNSNGRVVPVFGIHSSPRPRHLRIVYFFCCSSVSY